MKTRKLVMALGLAVLLLILISIIGCGSAENDQPINGESANPMEEMEKPGEGQGWEGKLSDIPGYPEGLPISNGIVRKITSNALDLEIPTGGGAVIYGSEYESGTQTKMIQVAFNPSTKVYRWLHRVAKPELQELTLADLSEGQSIDIWGEEMSGDRVFADTIIIRH